MGELTRMIPQGPNIHCGNRNPHERHTNRINTVVTNAWCDGAVPLEGFAELTVRVPLAAFGLEAECHETVFATLREEGMWSLFGDHYESPDATTVFRLRTNNDGIDKVYRLGEGT